MTPKTQRHVAKKILIVGGVLLVLTVLLNIISLISIYAAAGSCDPSTSSCTFDTEQLVAKGSVVLAYIAVATLLSGVVMLLIESKHHQDKH